SWRMVRTRHRCRRLRRSTGYRYPPFMTIMIKRSDNGHSKKQGITDHSGRAAAHQYWHAAVLPEPENAGWPLCAPHQGKAGLCEDTGEKSRVLPAAAKRLPGAAQPALDQNEAADGRYTQCQGQLLPNA